MHARIAPLVLGAVAVLTLAGGACSSSKGSDRADPVVPVPTAPAETTTTAAPDPFAIPEVIDEAYVNRVLAALDQVDGEALRRVVATEGIDADVLPMLRAIYNDPQFALELESLRSVLARGLDNFKTPPGNRKTTVARLISASPNCILLEAETEFSDVLRTETPDVPDEVELFTLRPTQQDANPSRVNPTPWSVGNAEVIKRGEMPKKRATCET
ncbi:MAG: hypothetical protein M3P85_12775 [Actinomycetota bacterium]|nr:hypothetical protein [Actinomycetota bacterium]